MAQPMIFLKLDGIPGDSDDAKHKGEIELHSYSIHASNVNGQPHVDALHCATYESIAAPKLLKALMERTKIKQAVLSVRANGAAELEYSTRTFTDCRVTSYAVSATEKSKSNGLGAGTTGAIEPSGMMQFSLGFGKLEEQIKEIKADGTLGSPVKYGFDLNAGQPV
jgi:type VI secretion system secreted protein Hcp